MNRIPHLNALSVMADNRSLHSEVFGALLPSTSDGGVVLRVGVHPDVEGAEGGRSVGLHLHVVLGPKHGEDNVVTHHVKVPGDDGALVLILDENLVDL